MTPAEIVVSTSDTLALPEPIERHTAGWLLGFASAHTRRAYRTDLRAWMTFCAHADLDPLDARRAHLDGWARTLEASKATPLTVARRLASVSSWYGYLVAEELVTHSPVAHVRRPKLPDRGQTPVSPAGVQRIVRALRGPSEDYEFIIIDTGPNLSHLTLGLSLLPNTSSSRSAPRCGAPPAS